MCIVFCCVGFLCFYFLFGWFLQVLFALFFLLFLCSSSEDQQPSHGLISFLTRPVHIEVKNELSWFSPELGAMRVVNRWNL